MKFQRHKDFILFAPHHWWGYPRGYEEAGEIYIDIEAFYINQRDYNLLIKHEVGHTKGLEHTWFGVMSPYGLIRYLTTWL